MSRIEEFAKTTANAYTCDEILMMESRILHTLGWDVNHSTHCDFMHLMMSEWDVYADMYHPYFPRFRRRMQHGATNE